MTYHGGASLDAYLLARIEKRPDGCWLWTGHLLPNPRRSDLYGVAIHRDLPKRKVMAHRAVYEHLAGPIPDGLQLDHLCRVRQCVNPLHLEPVTRLRAAESTTVKALAQVQNLSHANARLVAELDDARKHPALAENVRLAHHLELAERERDEARAALRLQEARLADLARRYPQAFPGSAA